ncbi:unnamed protein product [Meloidogyne enterolobii]|uniref:Uncharacterized protein n=1 Tax=Meloidogyne enterolobii TaxID=390850 RepID=A0ACB0Y911_MELEN
MSMMANKQNSISLNINIYFLKETENNGEIKEIVNINSSIETQYFLEQKSNKGNDKLVQINENSQDVVEFTKGL